MTHEKIFKREDGSKVTVKVIYQTDWTTNSRWQIEVKTFGAGKIKEVNAVDTNAIGYLKTNNRNREAYILKKQLEYVTPAEILEVKLELWEKMKPSI